MTSRFSPIKRGVTVLVLLATIACTGEATDVVKDISGVWQRAQGVEPNTEREFSWGVSGTFVNSALEIDLLADPPTIGLPYRGEYVVREVRTIDERTIRVRYHFDIGGFDVVYEMHYADGQLWIEPIEGEPLIPHGEESPYYRVSGP